MSKSELESFGKSFSLFFFSLGLFALFLYYGDLKKETKLLDERIYSQMRLCSFDLDCKQFNLDFEEIDSKLPYTLLHNKNTTYSYFRISQSDKFVLKFSYTIKNYKKDLKIIKMKLAKELAIVLIVIIILSILFSLYSLYPLKSALRLTKEFVRDILHDVNTPLSSLRLNASLLKKEFGKNKKIERIEQSVDTILSLQNNLRTYLDEHVSAKENFELSKLIEMRVDMVQRIYPNILFKKELPSFHIYTNKDAMDRILDNLLTNAAKYNYENGSVTIAINGTNLTIADTGNGIKDSKKVFNRFYTENEKGIGIGLHIVKKLCDALKVDISLESELSKGTIFTLNLSKLTQH